MALDILVAEALHPELDAQRATQLRVHARRAGSLVLIEGRQLLEAVLKRPAHHVVQVVRVAHRNAVVEHHLIDVRNVADRDRRIQVDVPRDVLVERRQLGVDVVRQSIRCRSNVLIDQRLFRQRQLLVREFEFDLSPVGQLDLDAAGLEVLCRRGSIVRRERARPADVDVLALVEGPTLFVEPTMHPHPHAKSLLQLDQRLVGVEIRLVVTERISHLCSP